MAQYDINLREYWRVLKKRKAIVVLTAIILGFFSTAFAIFRAPTPVYISTCSIKFEKETTVEGLYARTISWSGGDDIETQMSIIKSFSVFERVAEKIGLIPKKEDKRDRNTFRFTSVIESLQSKVDVSRENFTNILNLQVKDTDPAFAQKLANTIAQTYRELHSEQQLRRTTEAIKYIDDQLANVRKKLRESEDEFNRFTQDNQLVSFDLQSENLLTGEQKLQEEARRLREERGDLEGVYERLNQFIKDPSGRGNNLFSAKASNQYQASNDQLVELLLKKGTFLEDYTPQHPEIIAIDRKIAETSKKMVILLELQMKELAKKAGDLEEELNKVGGKTRGLMEKKLEFNRLKRKVELHNDMTVLLERKNQEALIKKAEKPEEITIVKPALLPSTPVNPPKTTATGAMGILIGLILGLVTAFIVETFDTSLGAIEDIEETLGSEVLGVIPFADVKDIKDLLEERGPEGLENSPFLASAHLVTHFVPKSMIAESFRALRTNIRFKDAEKKIKTIAVTSASPQEGKSLVSINLAITMAQAGMKILLVGADMRKPMMGRAFGLEITPGLTDILMGNHPWRDVIKTITDILMGKMTMDEIMVNPGLDNLHIITSGAIPPNPSVLIESKRLLEFIGEAGKEYDLIIFDSPPILSTADAAILGSKMDGVLLVYRAGSIARGLLKRSATQLEQVNCNLMGVILNGMKPEFSPDFQDLKYYKYYYSQDEDEVKETKGKFAKAFSFKKDKEARLSKEKAEDSLMKKRGKPAEKGAKTSGFLKWFLLGIALVFLSAGVLWQSGLINSLRLLERKGSVKGPEKAKPLVRKTLKKGEIKDGPVKKKMPVS
ncbi:MAG: AAA family ATPase, partial [Pseudomonadota bacterium]